MTRRGLVCCLGAVAALATAWLVFEGGDRKAAIEAPEVGRTLEESAAAQPADPAPHPAEPDLPAAPVPEPPAERAPAASSLGADRRGHLAGRVVDVLGRPIEGARIRIAAMDAGEGTEGEERKSRLTGPDGAFRLEGLGEGPYLLVASADGRRSKVLRDVRPDVDHLEIELHVQRVIAGTVRDADTGDPVVRFRVEATGVTHFPDKSRRTISSDFASDDGSFVIPDPGNSMFSLLVEAEGFASESFRLTWDTWPEPRKEVEVRLRRALTVRGKVADGDSGAPVEGAQLSWAAPESPYQWWSVCKTGADGSFSTEGFHRGARLRVRHDEYADAVTEPLGMSGERAHSGLVIRLSRGGAVDGYARSESGSPVGGGEVVAKPEAMPADGMLRSDRSVTVDPSGYFLIRGLEPGKYRVEVTPPSTSVGDEEARRRQTLRASALVEAGRTTRVDFDAGKANGCAVRGRVFLGEEPLEGARIEIRWHRAPVARVRWADDWSDETGNDGSYEIRNVPAGEATLSVVKEGEGASEVGSWTVQVPASGVLPFDAHLAGGEIRGRVTRASDGVGIARVTVGVWGEGERRRSLGGWAHTDRGGRYRVRGLGPGAYNVSADVSMFPGDEGASVPELASLAPRSQSRIEVAPGEVFTVDFALEVGGSVLVRVVDPAGSPLPGEQVILCPHEENRTGVLKEGFTDALGVARMKGVAPGRILAALVRPEYASQCSDLVSVRPGEEVEVRLELKQPVALRLRVLDPGDAPVEDAWV
ncbi:MAG TPA: carboxypeptidase-like regulatory domain-containing protein, partial [Planctomycetota bacterium]|nr:carboxypeptidase-like regulatory domain-containing protein [Planctomycetota bacterium]